MHVSAHIVDEISIHALRKESDSIQHGDYSDEFDISIHALRKESDVAVAPIASADIFQSTLSVRRATRPRTVWPCLLCISIHALRKESDRCPVCEAARNAYFNPRSP